MIVSNVKHMLTTHPPPPRPLRLPVAAVVATASVAVAAARVLDAGMRTGRQTPLTTTAYSRPPKSRDSSR